MSRELWIGIVSHKKSPSQSNAIRIGCMGAALGCVVLSATAGCQGLGLRNRDGELGAYAGSEEDDWSVPYQSQPQNQSQKPNLGQSKKRVSFTKSSKANSRNEKSEDATSTPPTLVDLGPKSSKPQQLSSNLDSLMSTDDDEIDFDGALANLSPEYRDKLKMQYAAVRQRYKNSKLAGAGVTRSFTDGESDSDRDKLSSAEVNASLASNEKKSSVKIRMNDSTFADAGLPNANASSAIAKSTEPNAASLAAESKVVQATATSTAPTNGASPAGVQGSSTVSVAHATLPNPTNAPTSSTMASSAAPSSAAPSSAAPSSATPSTAVPGSVPQAAPSSAANLHQSISHSIELLEKQIAETPATDENLRLSQEVTLRMLYVAHRRLDDAVKPIEMLSAGESEFVSQQMLALYEASNPDAMPVRSRHWSLVMNHQREATHNLAAASNLEVKSVSFCTEVERYGVITKFPKNQFQADQEVLLYCEIENVSAEKIRNGFETQLQGSYEILDSQGRKVADQLLPMEPDLCQNHRRDYFIVYKIYMPQQIASGNYQLRLTIEDMKARKFGQGQIDFVIKK